jgi:hypothetical protein
MKELKKLAIFFVYFVLAYPQRGKAISYYPPATADEDERVRIEHWPVLA